MITKKTKMTKQKIFLKHGLSQQASSAGDASQLCLDRLVQSSCNGCHLELPVLNLTQVVLTGIAGLVQHVVCTCSHLTSLFAVNVMQC